MKLYRLKIEPSDHDGDGENFDEWFGSLREARKRRAELIAELADPEVRASYRMGTDHAIIEVTFAALPPRQLLLCVLNRRGYAESQREVVPAVKIR